VSNNDVLIVEDDIALRYILGISLESIGCSVRVAETGLAAMKAISTQIPNLIVLDVSLPDTDAFDIVRRLRKDPRFESISLIIHTTFDLTSSEQADLKLGKTEFVTKTHRCGKEFLKLVQQMIDSQD
jgi:CheY-like chemotaxis protein